MFNQRREWLSCFWIQAVVVKRLEVKTSERRFYDQCQLPAGRRRVDHSRDRLAVCFVSCAAIVSISYKRGECGRCQTILLALTLQWSLLSFKKDITKSEKIINISDFTSFCFHGGTPSHLRTYGPRPAARRQSTRAPRWAFGFPHFLRPR